MTIPESFDSSSRKTKISLKYTVRTKNHGHKKVALIPCSILALIHHVEYASIDAEAKA